MTRMVFINKINYGGSTLLDLTEDTVTPDSLLEGVTAHDATGATIEGQYNPPKVKMSKTVEIVENGTHTIGPDEGFDGTAFVNANVNVPTAPKTASGSITFDIVARKNTFTLGTVSFTPIACGWYFNESSCRGMATKDPSGASHGIGVNTGKSTSTTTYSPSVSVNGNTIAGSFYASNAARNAAISWWAIGNG